MQTKARGRQFEPIVLSSTDEEEDALNTTTHGLPDMDSQEGVVHKKEEGELTTTPEAIKTETGVTEHTQENFLEEGPSTSNSLAQTLTPILRLNTTPPRDRRPPNFLGERFFTSAVTMETHGINVVTAKDTSDEEPNLIPQAASGMSGGKTISQP